MMKKIINGIKYWAQLLLIPIYWLSFLFPRSKNIWLFGSTFGRRFADNPRYFYLYINQNREIIAQNTTGKQIRAIWISKDKYIVDFLCNEGYEAYHARSLKGIWYCLRGGIYFFDNYSKDINFWLSGGAVKFNMWHGVPLKKIQADNVFDRIRHPKNLWERFKYFPRRLSDEKKSHYILATSTFMRPIFASAFQTERVCTIGYPRVDAIAHGNIRNIYTNIEKNELDRIRQFLAENKTGKVVYYMPTFRDSEVQFFEVMELPKFNCWLQENNILFCAKLHPKSKLRQRFMQIESSNIINIEPDTDPYVFIEASDVLVTDYSSIYFDYLFVNKPIVFFDYDLEAYLQDSREMYFDYEDYTPGEKAQTMEDLMEALRCACYPDAEYTSRYAEERKQLRDKMFEQPEDAASLRLVDYAKNVSK